MSSVALPKALTLASDTKGFISEASRDKAFQVMRSQGENRFCFDCGARNASWISVTFAVYLCVNCSGNHRNLGSRVSFVRSSDLDNIKLEEVLRMELGGNTKAKHFFRSHGRAESVDYRSKPAERYRRALDREVQELLSEHRPELLQGNNSKSSIPPSESIASESIASESIAPGTSLTDTHSPEMESVELDTKPSDIDTPIQTRGSLLLVPNNQQHFAGSSTNKPVWRARTDDFDFDFESAFASGAVGSKVTSRPTPKSVVISQTTSHSLSAPKDLSQAKSISSADFIAGEGNLRSNAADFQRFRNATAISSDAFFNRVPAQKSFEDNASTKFSLYTDRAVQKASDLASAAQESLRSAASWFSKVSTTPPNL